LIEALKVYRNSSHLDFDYSLWTGWKKAQLEQFLNEWGKRIEQ